MRHSSTDKLWRLKQFLASIRRRGLFRTLKIAAFELWYEARFGASSGVVIGVDALDIGPEPRTHATEYFPSSYFLMHEAFGCGGNDWSGRTFVDFGCGMGRALLFVSTLPFREIIGVELSPSLADTARRNLTTYYSAAGKTEPRWRVETTDARAFEIPPEASVFYFFNPFDAVVLATVADRLVASLQMAPRRAIVIYVKPVYEEVFLARGFVPLSASTSDFTLFSIQPRRGGLTE